MAHLSIEAIVGQALLWANEEDLLICAKYATIVPDVSVADAQAKVDEHILAYGIGNDLSYNFPAVQEGVSLGRLDRLYGEGNTINTGHRIAFTISESVSEAKINERLLRGTYPPGDGQDSHSQEPRAQLVVQN